MLGRAFGFADNGFLDLGRSSMGLGAFGLGEQRLDLVDDFHSSLLYEYKLKKTKRKEKFVLAPNFLYKIFIDLAPNFCDFPISSFRPSDIKKALAVVSGKG